MPFAVVRMKRSNSGAYSARKAIPKDVRDEYKRLYGQRREAKFSLPARTDPREAKTKYVEWLSIVEGRLKAIREKQAGVARSLSEREALALAGEWYSAFVALHEDNPGTAERWNEYFWIIIDRLEEHRPAWIAGDETSINSWIRDPAVREGIRPALAEETGADRFLADKGLSLTPESYALFLDRVLDELLNAVQLLERRAKRDYSPDPRLAEFPKFTDAPKAYKRTTLTPWALFDAYVAAMQPAKATVTRWRAVFLHLDNHFTARPASEITNDAAQAWADGLVNKKRGPLTVNDTWCSAARTVFNWGVKTRKLSNNPFQGVRVTQPRKVRTRETDEFYLKEAACILRASLAIGDVPETTFDGAKRWVPWLCAYTGARAGEITQLRGEDIVQQEGTWAIRITPEAGTTKAREPRTVPLHEHLLAQGFLEFVRSKGNGPLFYNPVTLSPLKATKDDPTNPRRPRAVKTRDRLAGWVREIGVTDKAVRPNHAWRHTFKRRAARAKIEHGIRDAICGHSPRTVADIYETPTLEDVAEALKRFPRYELD